LATLIPPLELIKEESWSKFSIWVCKRSPCKGKDCILLLLLLLQLLLLSIGFYISCFASFTHMVVVNIIIVIMSVTEKRKQEDLFKSLATSCLCGNPKKQQHEPKKKTQRKTQGERESKRKTWNTERGGWRFCGISLSWWWWK